MLRVPNNRIRRLNSLDARNDGLFVLYWMIANRRVSSNYSLDRSLWWANVLKKPLVILEGIRSGHSWACDRFHRFVIDGMRDNLRRLNETPIYFYPYIEPFPGASKGLLKTLSRYACIIVTDDFPCFFLPRMLAAASAKVETALEAVDSNGLLPIRKTNRTFQTAFSFRSYLQKELPAVMLEKPESQMAIPDGLQKLQQLPDHILKKWPVALLSNPFEDASILSLLPINHDVSPCSTEGGSTAAQQMLTTFLSDKIDKYSEKRNEPEAATSCLSPYLHWGHIGVHEIVWKVLKRENWSPSDLDIFSSRGKRNGWWGLSDNAEAFLDELITWRELGFNMCVTRPDYDRYESLPAWALETLDIHGTDPRPYLYDFDELENAATHDELWNACQNQLRLDGYIYGYLRMLWGKKILEWTPSPRIALKFMIELNNKYALDGRDPNSYSGIFWILGRYDRPWGPQRSVFGKIRYMSTDRAQKKLHLQEYIHKYS
jgi:deoxyribodipyrimidine photo-lyase